MFGTVSLPGTMFSDFRSVVLLLLNARRIQTFLQQLRAVTLTAVFGNPGIGMKVFFKHPRIQALWEQDCKANSYYGFRPPQ
jgi:hypothetical protein